MTISPFGTSRPDRRPPFVIRIALVSAILATLGSCVAAPSLGETSPAVSQPSGPSAPTGTSTVAFPTVIPSATWTPGATLTPTVDLLPEFGVQILDDPMDDPTAWDLAATASGGAAFTDDRLTLSVRTPRVYQSARRKEPIVGDFFAEVDVVTEVCSPGDEIGLTARGGGLGEQYRFLIGCDGTARITRILEDGSRALTLRVVSPAIHSGAPAQNHLSVWLRGLDLKFFVNGDEVLTVRDAALTRGYLGVIARAGPGGQVSVGFDNLLIYALADANPTGTPTPAEATVAPTTLP